MRLIDADKIIYSWIVDADGEEHDGVTLQSIIRKMPTTEPEIIRCKDCKWRNVYQFPPKYDERDYCDKHEKTVSADGFCSWAERRMDE